jgi:hypothetical protein
MTSRVFGMRPKRAFSASEPKRAPVKEIRFHFRSSLLVKFLTGKGAVMRRYLNTNSTPPRASRQCNLNIQPDSGPTQNTASTHSSNLKEGPWRSSVAIIERQFMYVIRHMQPRANRKISDWFSTIEGNPLDRSGLSALPRSIVPFG